MKKNVLFGLSLFSLLLVSCGGGEEEAGEETEVTEEVAAVEYTINAEESAINWWNLEGGEKGHTGTVGIVDGSYTLEGDVITAGALTVDMQSITSDSERLTGHLMTDHFFSVLKADSVDVDSVNWVPNNPTAAFTFEKHEEGTVYGTINVAGTDFPVEAPVTVGEGTLEFGEFSIDMGILGYFVMEAEDPEVPEEERHNSNIGFTASIVGTAK